jgi:hypothetical protein
MDSMQIIHILLVAFMVIIVLSIIFVFAIASHGLGLFKYIFKFLTNNQTVNQTNITTTT